MKPTIASIRRLVVECTLLSPAELSPDRDLLAEGLPPHEIHELWLCMIPEPDHKIDVTALFEYKIEALRHHVSQFDHLDELETWLRERWAEETDDGETLAPTWRRRPANIPGFRQDASASPGHVAAQSHEPLMSQSVAADWP